MRILTGCTVTGFKSDSAGGAIQAVETDKGEIGCDQVVIGAGPWAKTVWDMLELPKTISIKGADGSMHDNVPMWIYWSLQEGTLGVDPELQKTNDGQFPPVIHVDSNEPLYSDYDGSLLTDQMWGIYYKPDFHFGGIQGGAAPLRGRYRPGRGRGRPLRRRFTGLRRRRGFRAHVDLGAGALPEALRRPVRVLQE